MIFHTPYLPHDHASLLNFRVPYGLTCRLLFSFYTYCLDELVHSYGFKCHQMLMISKIVCLDQIACINYHKIPPLRGLRKLSNGNVQNWAFNLPFKLVLPQSTSFHLSFTQIKNEWTLSWIHSWLFLSHSAHDLSTITGNSTFKLYTESYHFPQPPLMLF